MTSKGVVDPVLSLPNLWAEVGFSVTWLISV